MPSQLRYIVTFLATIGLVFALTWSYSWVGRFGFSETEYAVWRAKLEMVDRCDLGDIAILGESRASAGFIPSYFPVPVSNLALSGSGPIEAYYEWRRMARCPHLPKLVILSYWPDMFSKLSWFWPRSARYGLFTYDDLEEIRANERKMSPGVLYRDAHAGRLSGIAYNWMHIYHFPPFDFANFVSSGLIRRLPGNLQAYRETLSGRGQHVINPKWDPIRASWVCASKPMPMQPRFVQVPLVSYYFEQLLADLKARNIKVIFMPTPVSRMTENQISAGYKDDFYDFIRRYGGYFDRPLASRDEMFPEIDDCGFGDNTHLNPTAAEDFSVKAASQLLFATASASAASPAGR